MPLRYKYGPVHKISVLIALSARIQKVRIYVYGGSDQNYQYPDPYPSEPSSEWNSEANRASVGTGCNFQYEPNSSHLLFHDEIRRGTGGPDPPH